MEREAGTHTQQTRGSRPMQARSRATRARILRTAEELCRSQGFERTSMEQVAQVTGIGKGTLYHHFPDKRALLLDLIDACSERLATERRWVVPIETFMRGDPRSFVAGLIRFVYERMKDRNWIYVEFFLLARRDEELRERYQKLLDAGVERMARMIRLGQERGFLRQGPDPMSAAILWNNALELLEVRMHLLDRPADQNERILHELTDMICRYLVDDG